MIINFRNEENKRTDDPREPANFNINNADASSNNQPVPREPNIDTTNIQEEEWDEVSIQNALKKFIFTVLKWNTLSLIFFVCLLIALKWNLSYLYPLVFLWLVDVYNIVTTVNTISDDLK